MKWNELSLKEKAELMKLYVSNGITKLDDIITHYNAYQEGGKITFEQWKQQMQQLYPDIEMDNNRAGYDYNAYFNNNYNAAIAQLTNLQHFPDTYKLPNHPTFSNESIYHNYPTGNIGGKWVYSKPWETRWGGTDAFIPSEANYRNHPEIYNEAKPYTEDEIYSYQQGGNLGKVTPYGQWEYPHQVTTIPSNNITMKGVDYPVLGISDTGDTKYMLPNMDYLFDGNYVTEYPLHKFQRGSYITNGRTLADGRTVYPISDLPAEDTPTSLPAARIDLKPVTVTAKHPLWDLPDYQGKEGNPNINAHKDELYQNRRRREEAGKEYLKRVAGGLSVMALPIGGAAGFILGVPDLATDFAEMTDKPSVSNATELTLDAPTRYGTELDNALISILKSNKYTKPLAKILQYNDALQYIGAANDAASAVTGKSIIEHVSK